MRIGLRRGMRSRETRWVRRRLGGSRGRPLRAFWGFQLLPEIARLKGMAIKSFFGDEENEYFDLMGRPKLPGIYEFMKSDGRKIIYTLDFMEREDSDAEPRLKVVRASRIQDYPSPTHALKNLDGQWLRYLGLPTPDESPSDAQSEAGVQPQE
jgi:hypothetical protein